MAAPREGWGRVCRALYSASKYRRKIAQPAGNALNLSNFLAALLTSV